MGMCDTFYVRKENKVGIPVDESGYQSKSLEACSCASIVIDENGRLSLEHEGDLFYNNKDAKAIRQGTFCSTDLDIYAEDEEGVWNEYSLIVLDNQIVRVKLYDKLVYLAEGYPMLDETINPVPEGGWLDIELTVGVYPDAGKRSHRFYHNRRDLLTPPDASEALFQPALSSKHYAGAGEMEVGDYRTLPKKIAGWVQQVQDKAPKFRDVDELELMYPEQMKVLAVDPGNPPIVGLIEFQNGTIVGLDKIIAQGSLDKLKHFDVNPEFFNPDGSINTAKMYESLGKNNMHKSSVWLARLANITHRPVVVYARDGFGNKHGNYSKAIQSIVVSRRVPKEEE
jgi:hypothetical protein